jgi:uncharacterized protein YyaL (SSP411 family)
MRRLALGVLLSLCGCAATPDAPAARPPAASNTAPTAWASWSAEAFERAQAENRIILINVVASWCHWCHVMDEKTYANPEVAALLAEHFVALRVDSDARPDVAERYRAWGWPATAVLTPGAQPVLELRGYQNPERFAALLRELVAERDAGTLKRRAPAKDTAPAPSDLDTALAQATKQLDGYYSEAQGGWGRNQKYPFAEPLEHALWRGVLHGDTRWASRAERTLIGHARLVDPVWGGMYQYSLRGDWDHPHYEKITAIQAGALHSFSVAALVTGEPRWLEPAQAVRSYMNTFMRDEAGGYATSQDADFRSGHGEAVLGIEYYALPDDKRRALGLPRIDANVYTDLNGMMVGGLALLSVADDDPGALADAVETAERLHGTHRGSDGLFRHGQDDASSLRFLRDQAAMLWGLMALHRTTADAKWLDRARTLADAMLGALQDPEHGGFYAHTPDPAAIGALAQRRRPLEENALAARALLRLHRAVDGSEHEPTPYLDAARQALLAVAPDLPEEGRIIGTYVLALEEVTAPSVDITVVGPAGDTTTDALYRAALRLPEPRAALERSLPGERYPDIGKPAVYLCTANACSPPLKDPATFGERATAILSETLPPR